MKTYEKLMTHYWGKIVPMAEAAGINPWECVRYIGVAEYYDHPIFDGMLDHYTFAKKVFMGKPAFVGDKVWLKKTEQWITVINGNPAYLDPELCSWTPPTKKRTFMLGDKELPCPDIDNDKGENAYFMRLGKYMYRFNEIKNREIVEQALKEIFTAARDKE